MTTDTAPQPIDQSAANLRGMCLIIVSMGVFILNDTLTKIAATELPGGEVIMIRSLIAVVLMLPVVHFTSGLHVILRSYSRPLLVRNVAEVFALILYLSALFHLPIANVTAILQTLPLAMTAAAALFLGEKVGWRRWTAAAVGFAGVLLIVRPGTTAFSWWYVSALVSIIFITARDLATRFIAPTTPTLAVTLLTAAIGLLAGAIMGTQETWIIPSHRVVGIMTCAAVLVLIGYHTLIESWRAGEISVIAPFRYSVVLWAILFGYLMLGELPDLWMLAGSAIVIAAGLYTFLREQQLRRAR